jgi:hypothetical protein
MKDCQKTNFDHPSYKERDTDYHYFQNRMGVNKLLLFSYLNRTIQRRNALDILILSVPELKEKESPRI